MSINIKGKLGKRFPIQEGTSKTGKAWKKQDFLVMMDDKFNPQVIITAMGDDKIKRLDGFEVGEGISVNCNIGSREFKGKYFTSVSAFGIFKSGDGSPNSQAEFDAKQGDDGEIF